MKEVQLKIDWSVLDKYKNEMKQNEVSDMKYIMNILYKQIDEKILKNMPNNILLDAYFKIKQEIDKRGLTYF